MKRPLAQALYLLLSVVIVTAGLPAWSHSPTADSFIDVAVGQAERSPSAHPDCHDQAERDADASEGGEMLRHACCEDETTCSHDECNCECAALSYAVPTRRLDTRSLTPFHPWHEVDTISPRSTVSTLLRPPRA